MALGKTSIKMLKFTISQYNMVFPVLSTFLRPKSTGLHLQEEPTWLDGQIQFKNEHLRLQERLEHMAEKWGKAWLPHVTLTRGWMAATPWQGQPTRPQPSPTVSLSPQLMPTPTLSHFLLLHLRSHQAQTS